jgi:hypothetical protein
MEATTVLIFSIAALVAALAALLNSAGRLGRAFKKI